MTEEASDLDSFIDQFDAMKPALTQAATLDIEQHSQEAGSTIQPMCCVDRLNPQPKADISGSPQPTAAAHEGAPLRSSIR